MTDREQTFFIGTYTQKVDFTPQANGKGIVTCTIDPDSGRIQQNDIYTDVINASYLAKSPDDRFLFAAIDRPDLVGEVQVLSIDATGHLNLLSSVSAKGVTTCHITCDQVGDRIFAASYKDGKLSVFEFDGKTMSPASQVVSYEGTGPNKQRQEAAHAHQAVVSPDGRWLYICDLGSDTIWLHALSDKEMNKAKAVEVKPGYGPRHMVCHPTLPVNYVFCELNSHLLTMKRDEKTGLMTIKSDDPTLPSDYTGQPSGAAIKLHPTNKALYVSNRLHDSISVFTVDEQDGHLTFVQWFPCGGKEPRDFAIDPTGSWLVVSNQNSDTIVPFKLDPDTGLPTGEKGETFHCGTPVCIVFR